MRRVKENLPNPAIEPVKRGNGSSQTGIFARSGEFWTINYGSVALTLRDIKGLRYIQRLLEHPGEQFHALDLLAPPEAGPGSDGSPIDLNALPVGVTVRRGLSGDAGQMLDAHAKRDYQRRHAELKEQLEDLLERGERERAEEVEAELDILRRQLSNAFGIGGRDRRAGSNAERARLNVSRSIRAALQKVSEHHADFGELLNRFDSDRPLLLLFARSTCPYALALLAGKWERRCPNRHNGVDGLWARLDSAAGVHRGNPIRRPR